ncbi:LysR family transcriptional regulator [Glutamicibacter sp. JC586]|uniref:LysR family transcriptional regulator n=1 Tax=Glutamicibacter sp. JC586 TaxID=2590552 RepID=UPI00135BE746|nr:LysR family transcriptional regulator [Glutamicibacter sp. JC586]
MTLTQLEAFLCASELGTFTAAAAHLDMSQPAISDLIRRLEQELKAPLFHRGSRSLVLTAAGEQLLPHARQSVASAAQGREAVLSQMSLAGGTATFGLLRNADYYLKTDLAMKFRRQYPKVNIRLVGQNSSETASDVASGVLEAGLLTLPIDDEGLEILPIARDELLCASASKQRVSSARAFEDFLATDLVLYDAHYPSTDPVRRQLNEQAQLIGKSVMPEIEVEYLSTAISLVAAGFGDTILCQASVSSLDQGLGIHTIPFETPIFDVLALVKRTGTILSPATRELARLAVDSLMEHQKGKDGTAEILATENQIERFLDVTL